MYIVFQYNPCYCSIRRTSNRSRSRRHVSIQPLLLFYDFVIPKIIVAYAFQYNPCYCSMALVVAPVQLFFLFQYNPCYCSISNTKKCSKCIFVSIQPLLLFYRFSIGILNTICLRFNTTLVTVL